MSVFLTGATGFIGRRLLARLLEEGRESLRCLVRDPARLAGGGSEGAGVREAASGGESAAPGAIETVRGDLRDPDSYRSALAGCTIAVHAAALTGKGRRSEHFRVNAEGTRLLLEACRAAGVPRFLHVSTIAVRFPEKRAYPYAASKQRSEEFVRASGLDWAIVRPTTVLGPESPLWRKLGVLARLPVTPVFGGGRNRIQPVHVEDVVAGIVALMEEPKFAGRIVELGGGEVLTMGEFLAEMRRALRGRDGPLMRVPVRPIIAVLRVLEPVLLPVLPAAAGQFYAFRYESCAAFDPQDRPPLEERRGARAMIREWLARV